MNYKQLLQAFTVNPTRGIQQFLIRPELTEQLKTDTTPIPEKVTAELNKINAFNKNLKDKSNILISPT
jgi:hypothetical protein